MNKFNSQKRRDFFVALCYLSFAGSTIAFTGYFIAALFFGKFAEWIIRFSSWNSVERISPLYFNIFMVLYALSLTGVIRMWKFRRDGFFIYLMAQTAILFTPVFWLGWPSFSVNNAIFTLIFIAGYAINYRSLR